MQVLKTLKQLLSCAEMFYFSFLACCEGGDKSVGISFVHHAVVDFAYLLSVLACASQHCVSIVWVRKRFQVGLPCVYSKEPLQSILGSVGTNKFSHCRIANVETFAKFQKLVSMQ